METISKKPLSVSLDHITSDEDFTPSHYPVPQNPISPSPINSQIITSLPKLQSMHFDATFKLILIGDSGVGKSCIIRRMGSNTFSN
jgi:hypothetical protein